MSDRGFYKTWAILSQTDTSKAEADREAKRRATAVPWDDSMAGLIDEDKYYACPEDYFDYHWQSSSEDVPNPNELCYEYEAVVARFGLRAKTILELAWEQCEPPEDDDFDEPWTPEDVARLQTLLDDWMGSLKAEAKWYTSGRYVDLTEIRKAWCEEVAREQAEDAK